MIELLDGGKGLKLRKGQRTLCLEAWGTDSVRIRITENPRLSDENWALLPDPAISSPEANIGEEGKEATFRHGDLEVHVTGEGSFSVRRRGSDEQLLATRTFCFQPREGRLFRLEADFDAHPDERFYGMGQRQHGFLDQKGCVLDLEQRNMEVSIPFLISSRGYGFLWNNPAVGRVELAENRTRWVAESTEAFDCWITVGDVQTVLSRYADVTGHCPPMPEWALGFWQSKMRYRTQDEALFVAREYRRRGLPLSVLVIDALHWTAMGDWRFQLEEWPDPTRMVQELREMGVEPVVSIWPTATIYSENFNELQERGLLVQARRGLAILNEWYDKKPTDGAIVSFYNYDSTHPEARQFLWERVQEGYRKHGIRCFWLDAGEPELQKNAYDNLRFFQGDGETIGCLVPSTHLQCFYEGLAADQETDILLLTRSGWAGCQRYGAAIWSGDVASDWAVLRKQIAAGLNVGLSGVPWWTTDIGGFKGGDPNDPAFQELVVRWFQFGAFSPIFRLHGMRDPSEPLGGAANEVWSFGERAFPILAEYLTVRERLRPYLREQMRTASEKGWPVMRPLFFEFPDDANTVGVQDAYLLGPDVLVAPIIEPGATNRSVYLPAGTRWQNAWTNEQVDGGQWLTVDAPLERIPVFVREGSSLSLRST